MTAAATAARPFLELVGVVKVLGGRRVLAGVDLQVRRGETLAILGASGSGKSVTLRHVVGLMHPDEGRVVVDGEDVTEFTDRQFMAVRAKVSYIFQGGALFDSMTVGENCAFGLREQAQLGRDEIAERVRQSLDAVDLAGTEDLLPSDLSGGMRKRVALARSMALKPACLLYDEPTAGLDPVTGFLVSDLIRTTAARLEVTSVVVTHDIPSAYYVADRLAFLEDGRIGFIGTVAAARRTTHPGLRRFLDAYGGGDAADRDSRDDGQA